MLSTQKEPEEGCECLMKGQKCSHKKEKTPVEHEETAVTESHLESETDPENTQSSNKTDDSAVNGVLIDANSTEANGQMCKSHKPAACGSVKVAVSGLANKTAITRNPCENGWNCNGDLPPRQLEEKILTNLDSGNINNLDKADNDVQGGAKEKGTVASNSFKKPCETTDSTHNSVVVERGGQKENTTSTKANCLDGEALTEQRSVHIKSLHLSTLVCQVSSPKEQEQPDKENPQELPNEPLVHGADTNVTPGSLPEEESPQTAEVSFDEEEQDSAYGGQLLDVDNTTEDAAAVSDKAQPVVFGLVLRDQADPGGPSYDDDARTYVGGCLRESRRLQGLEQLNGSRQQSPQVEDGRSEVEQMYNDLRSRFRAVWSQQRNVCRTCDRQANTVFLNCHHIVVCQICARRMLLGSDCPYPGCPFPPPLCFISLD